MGNAGIDPDVDRIGAMTRAFGQPEFTGKRGVIKFEPDVRAAFLDDVRQLPDNFWIEDRFAFWRIKNRQRYAPTALTRDHPIRPRFDRARDPVLAPGRNPFHAFDRGERIRAQIVDPDEELFDGAEDDRRLRAPAIRIGVLVRLGCKQHTFWAPQHTDDRAWIENIITEH